MPDLDHQRPTPAAPERAGNVHAPDMVTVVIEHRPRPMATADYEKWLSRIIPIAGTFPGHRGVHVLRPPDGQGPYTVTLRFDDLEAARHWLASDTRRDLMEKVVPLLQQDEDVRTVTGLEFWFTAPAARERRAPAFKQFLVALSVIYPLTLVAPWLLHPMLEWLQGHHLRLLAHLAEVGVVVYLMTYIIMPRYTRWVAGWLYR